MFDAPWPTVETDQRYFDLHGHYPEKDNKDCSLCRNTLMDELLDSMG